MFLLQFANDCIKVVASESAHSSLPYSSCFLKDWVGVFPEGEEALVSSSRLCRIT